MAQALSIADASKLTREFFENPADPELQVKIVDATRRYPIAMMLLAAGRHDILVEGQPFYMTLRKTNDGVITYDKKELRSAIQALTGDEDGDEGEDEAPEDTVEETPVVAAKPVKAPKAPKTSKEKAPVAAGAPASNPGNVDVSDLFEDE
ncbi:MAG TPA: hypothetical protein VL443_08160 [Cyclobacteriaceae bacterium]|jgi:hypothetical protein|nr:hypothetical protein [Cyclobacteriaceae bacterium]